MLAGIVVNNAIVLVDYVNHLRRREGVAKIAALVQAGQVRFRPILMPTSTTILALLPMALGLGELMNCCYSFGPMFTSLLGRLSTNNGLD